MPATTRGRRTSRAHIRCHAPGRARPAAASLAGLTARRLRPLLAELIAAHLVVEHVPGRYLSHDLLRAYAAELAGAAERQAACHRVLDHYLHTAFAGAMLLDPQRNRRRWPRRNRVPHRSGCVPRLRRAPLPSLRRVLLRTWLRVASAAVKTRRCGRCFLELPISAFDGNSENCNDH
jgi:hypothetical protein